MSTTQNHRHLHNPARCPPSLNGHAPAHRRHARSANSISSATVTRGLGAPSNACIVPQEDPGAPAQRLKRCQHAPEMLLPRTRLLVFTDLQD